MSPHVSFNAAATRAAVARLGPLTPLVPVVLALGTALAERFVDRLADRLAELLVQSPPVRDTLLV